MSLPKRATNSLQPLLRLPSHLHAHLTQTNKLLPSPHQQAVLPHLDTLTTELPSHARALRSYKHELSHLSRLRQEKLTNPPSALRLLLGGYAPSTPPSKLPNTFFSLSPPPPAPVPPAGLYLHGDVGSGKTLLMDLLFACAPLPARRVHFHAFMISLYQALHEYDVMHPKARLERGWRHPLDAAIGEFPGLLCFDEFQIADIADARMLHGVFDRFLKGGTVVCFTSNRTPADVNRSQMRDEDFQPFLELLYERCRVVPVDGVDYRGVLAKIGEGIDCYFEKADEDGVKNVWESVTGCAWDDVVTAEWDVGYGRKIKLDRVCGRKGVQMKCEELLERPVSAADYRAIAKNTGMIFLTDVLESFGNDTRNLARRFITLVDVCYEERVRLVMRLENGLDGLFEAVEPSTMDFSLAEGLQFEGEIAREGVGAGNRAVGLGTLYTGEDERFAFRRAISRLREMRMKGFGRVLWE